jgi:hypothetical protein
MVREYAFGPGRTPAVKLDDIYAAASEGRLVDLFLKIDDSGIIEICAENPKARAEMESAFADAVEALKGREIRKTGVGDNALCMVMAIVLEAIQQAVIRHRLIR